MKKVKLVGTVDSFYFVPNSENETAVLYLNVLSEQTLPQGREETFVPPKQMRFVLQDRELGVLSRGAMITPKDKMTIYICEDSQGELSYNIGKIEQSPSVIDAKEYVKKMLQ